MRMGLMKQVALGSSASVSISHGSVTSSACAAGMAALMSEMVMFEGWKPMGAPAPSVPPSVVAPSGPLQPAATTTVETRKAQAKRLWVRIIERDHTEAGRRNQESRSRAFAERTRRAVSKELHGSGLAAAVRPYG